MRRHLQPGTRVRVTSANSLPSHRPGDTGTVKGGPHPSPLGGQYYIVQMDNDMGSGPAIFMTEEIEPAD